MPVIDRYLDDLVRWLRLPANLVEAIRYALLGGGKRIRPVLAWHCCAAVGGRGEDALPVAAAIELIHAFSLVHDDLPAMDDDDLRRGKPTLHVHAGEAMAILAGDAMMALAFETLVERTPDAAVGAALVRELSIATTGMISGQVYDTLGGLPPDLNERARLETIHRNKTGALICAACRMGALAHLGPSALPAPPTAKRPLHPKLDAVSIYGHHIGLIFQIVDDLLDVETTPEQSGKRTRKDAAAGKSTYPALIGVDASRVEVQRLTQQALAALEPLGSRADPLRDLARFMATRTS